MPAIRLVDISKHLCQGVNLEIRDKELLVIVGTTGAGKTTLLNVIAGVTGYRGHVFFDDANVDKVAPKKRGVGYLFQDLSLFPHLTVEANIAFGLRAGGQKNTASNQRVSYLLEMMRIEHLASRYPHTLSGGEKKRVALARSLAPSPNILLLDEPTSSLDHQTAKYLRSELIPLIRGLGITVVYVTHDLREAEELADRIALMSKGEIHQVSSPSRLFFSPSSKIVSEFTGMPNILRCDTSRTVAPGLVEVVSDEIKVILPYHGEQIKKIAISPEDIYISNAKPPGPSVNRFMGRVEEIVQHDSKMRVRVSVGKNHLIAELPRGAFDEMSVEEGSQVHVVIKLRRLRYAEK